MNWQLILQTLLGSFIGAVSGSLTGISIIYWMENRKAKMNSTQLANDLRKLYLQSNEAIQKTSNIKFN